LTSVAEALRSAREARQLSLEEIHGALGIPLHYLRAMEGAGTSLIADEFYLVPFLRRYAEYLDLDGATVVARFLAESGRRDAGGAGSAAALGRRRRGRIGWGWVAAGLAAIAAAAVIAWAMLG
jgi:cytoskeletal protein RodZ